MRMQERVCTGIWWIVEEEHCPEASALRGD